MSKNKRRLGQIRFEALAEVIGVEAAKVLTEHHGGETLAIPRCTAAILEMRNRAIRQEFDELTRTHSANHAASELARKYHITDRWVYQVLSRADSHDNGETMQGGLF
jgi:Mor family transcriptional regulator